MTVITPAHCLSKVERMARYASIMHHLNDKNLTKIASDPNRAVAEVNERLAAIFEILHRGIIIEDEVFPLLELVKDNHDFPIYGKEVLDKDTRENNALLRGEAALALARHGLKSKDFADSLKQTLYEMAHDPLFVTTKGASMYFKNFLAALYETDKNSAIVYMETYSVSDSEMQRYLV